MLPYEDSHAGLAQHQCLCGYAEVAMLNVTRSQSLTIMKIKLHQPGENCMQAEVINWESSLMIC